jgi:hypothetical protein
MAKPTKRATKRASRSTAKSRATSKALGASSASSTPARKTAAARSPAKKPTSSKRKRSSAKKEKCFIISPFGSWFDRYYDEIYVPAVEAAGLDPVRADDLYRPSAIMHDIWGFVRTSRVMVADLTDKNPNVFYELGLAHAVGKPVILLTQEFEDIPFDLRSLRVIQYSVEDPVWGATLKKDIQRALLETLADPTEAILAPFLHQKVDKTPSVSSEDKRFLELEQMVASLRTEVARSSRGNNIGPDEARHLIQRYLDQGMPHEMVIRRVRPLGPPPSWIEKEIATYLGTGLKSPRKRSSG